MWACGPGDVIPRTGDLLGQERTFKTLASDLLISLPKKKKNRGPARLPFSALSPKVTPRGEFGCKPLPSQRLLTEMKIRWHLSGAKDRPWQESGHAGNNNNNYCYYYHRKQPEAVLSRPQHRLPRAGPAFGLCPGWPLQHPLRL